ncbi:outer membrane beta-barrel family protein [Flavivirga aquimarina]|uniref:Outer membrane beta-barrel family protein n=1 Tax=Flavivirga aquimarina TaxID=2027862 RepID=A0ABT8WDG6_9FLAO|nr:outer membrane beta-barrel family protein [Flavivirga aquimarina]MDO5971194.1 outer membrane beta-barrel family protein [Flavivirga aquimarina]
MRQTIFLSITISLFTNILSAQRPESKEVNITGKVIDKETKEPLEYATIALFNKRQNKIVTGGITDINGNFSIDVLSGIYDISIEYISFKTITIPNKKLSTSENIGTYLLEIDTESLAEVEIIAERTTVELKLDKKIYNIGKDLTVRGGTVSDVLDNVPSVSVDVEGNVALRGNDNVRILINGKPSGLVGLNSTDALQQLPAEAIEKIEIITSPSARYDAEGTAGILNIILRRSKLQGLNGAITTNAGYPTSAGVSGNINYRTGDFNFFNTTGYSYRESPGNALTETQYFNEYFDEDLLVDVNDPDTFINEKRIFDRQRKSLTTNFGLEWYINDTASLTASFVHRNSDNTSNTSNTITELDIDGSLLSESIRLEPELEDDKTIQYSINFDKQFNGNSEHRLTFDFQYETSTEDENAIITQDGDDAEQVRTLEEQNEILLQTDYTLPIGENAQFEAGYRGTFNELNTDYTLKFNENDAFVLDTNASNNLIYREYVNAAYSQFGSKIANKFSFLLGLRMESTRITINQITSGDFDRKNYVEFFPTVNLAYEVSEDQSFILGYNRRISRPRSRYINPFPSRSSATNLFQGNPDIDPSFSNTVDLGYLNSLEKLTLNSSIYFSRSTDVFTFITEATGDFAIVNGTEVPVIRRTPINLATNDRLGFEFTLTYRPNKKWNLNGNFNLFDSKTRGSHNDVIYDADNLSWFVRLNNKYTLPGDIDWQTRLFYMGPTEDAQNLRKGMFSSNLAFSKDLFKSKASLAFSINDLFNSRKRIVESFTDSFNSYGEFQRRERSFNISYTHRFNQKKTRENEGRRGNNGGDEDFGFEG